MNLQKAKEDLERLSEVSKEEERLIESKEYKIESLKKTIMQFHKLSLIKMIILDGFNCPCVWTRFAQTLQIILGAILRCQGSFKFGARSLATNRLLNSKSLLRRMRMSEN